MPPECRRDVRYQSSQKAVLLTDDGVGSYCLITDLSKGGLCLALVGSPGPWKRERVDLEFNHRIFPCNIVDAGKTKLHCQFESPIGESDFRSILPFSNVMAGDEKIALKQRSEVLALSYIPSDESPEESKAASKEPPHNPRRYDLSVVYIEGSLAGKEQIDPAIDALDATVDVLNPYQVPEERESWKQGFKDAVRLVAKHYNLSR